MYNQDFSEKDYYQILEIQKNASFQDVQQAYFRLKKTFNDGNQAVYSLLDQTFISDSQQLIEEAYAILAHEGKRKLYDENLIRQQVIDKSQVFTYSEPQPAEPIPAPHYNIPMPTFEDCQPTKNLLTCHIKAPVVKEEKTQSQLAQACKEHDLSDGINIKKIRELIGMGLDEIQNQTKISRYHLDNLEQNNFDLLPQLVYVKGFLRSYLNYLAIPNTNEVVASYAERYLEWLKNKSS